MSIHFRREAPNRLSAGDHLRNLSDDLLRLAARIDREPRTHSEVEERMSEGERISQAVRRISRQPFRG